MHDFNLIRTKHQTQTEGPSTKQLLGFVTSAKGARDKDFLPHHRREPGSCDPKCSRRPRPDPSREKGVIRKASDMGQGLQVSDSPAPKLRSTFHYCPLVAVTSNIGGACGNSARFLQLFSESKIISKLKTQTSQAPRAAVMLISGQPLRRDHRVHRQQYFIREGKRVHTMTGGGKRLRGPQITSDR